MPAPHYSIFTGWIMPFLTANRVKALKAIIPTKKTVKRGKYDKYAAH